VRGHRRANATELRDYLYAGSLGQHPPKPTPPEDTGGTPGMGTIGILASNRLDSADGGSQRGGYLVHQYESCLCCHLGRFLSVKGDRPEESVRPPGCS
jgi:hypothetical protein